MTIRFAHLSEAARVETLDELELSRTRRLPAGTRGRIERLQFHADSWQLEVRLTTHDGSCHELWFDAGDGYRPAAARIRRQFRVIEEIDGLPDGEQDIWPLPTTPVRVESPLDAPPPARVDRFLLGDRVRLRGDLVDSAGCRLPAGTCGQILRLESDGTGDGGVVVMTLATRPGPDRCLRFGRRWFGARGHARFRDCFEREPVRGFRDPPAASPPQRGLIDRLFGRLPPSPAPASASISPAPQPDAPLDAHLDHLLDLTEAGRHAEAEAHWQAALAALSRSDTDARSQAETCSRLALRLVAGNGRIADLQLWGWFRDASLGAWQAHVSQATGAGEGIAMSREADEAERRLRRAEARHHRALGG